MREFLIFMSAGHLCYNLATLKHGGSEGRTATMVLRKSNSLKAVRAALCLGLIAFALGLLACAGCVDRSKQKEYTQKQATTMAAEFPKKRIKLICPPKQGGLSDFITRALAESARKPMGANIIVENRAGAAGATGMRFGAKAKPDGYTVTYVTVESAILKHRTDVEETASYEDFELLARLNYGPAALTVQADSPWATLADFVEYAKAHPGELKVGNSGEYSIWHLASAAAADQLGMSMGYVPYDGSAPAKTSLLGGHIHAIVSSPSEVLPEMQNGSLRILAVFGEERDPAVPDAPTARELGYDVVVGAWGGLGVPIGTPDEIKKILYKNFKKGFDSKEFQDACAKRGVTLAWLPPDEFLEFAKQEDRMFGKVLGSAPMEDEAQPQGLSVMAFPRTIMIVIGVLVALLVVSSVASRKPDAEKEPVFGPNVLLMLGFFALLAVYIFLLTRVGYVLSTVAFLGASFALLNPKRSAGAWAAGAAFSLLAGLGVYYLFSVFLNVPVIEGPVDIFVRKLLGG
jgi:tripartite-type tricarboxylate transporter receptor subunit TctC